MNASDAERKEDAKVFVKKLKAIQEVNTKGNKVKLQVLKVMKFHGGLIQHT
jgi:spore coat protein CotF